MIKFCKNCGNKIHQNKEGQFCGQCGTKLPSLVQTSCWACHQPISNTAQFCGHCGESQKISKPDGQETTKSKSEPPIQQAALKSVKKRRPPLAITSILAIVSLIAIALTAWYFLGSVDRDKKRKKRHLTQSEQTIGESTGKFVFGGDTDKSLIGKWPTPPVSGTKAQKVFSREKIQISVAENALDKERDLILEPLAENELRELAIHPRLQGTAMFDAYHFEAGLSSGESIPGDFEITYDLSQTGFDPAMYDSIRVVRIGEDETDIQYLNSHVDGGILKASTNRNSVIVLTTLMGIAIQGGIIVDHYRVIKKNFGKDPYRRYLDPTMKRYTFYWPENMGFGNPQALKAYWLKEVALYKGHDILPKDYDPEKEIKLCLKNGKYYTPFSAGMPYLLSTLHNYTRINTKLERLSKTPEYMKLKAIPTDSWLKANVFPKLVVYNMDCAKAADHYLYNVRGFKPPSSVDVYISPLVKKGLAYNPNFLSPYMVLPVLNKKQLENSLGVKSKFELDDYLITFTHELFHVTQSSRYVRTVEWDKQIWFWEATATLLENEAADYYKKTDNPNRKGTKLISNSYMPDRQPYDESYVRALGLFSYWEGLGSKEKPLQYQGYMTGYLLLYLKEHCSLLKSNPKDDFLLRLMNAYRGSIQNPLYTIVAQSTNSWEMFESNLKDYYILTAPEIAESVQTNSKIKTSNKSDFYKWINEPQFKISQNVPIVEIMPKKNPTGSPIRRLKIELDRKKYKTKQDVTLVIKRGNDALQNNKDLVLNVGNYKHQYREFTAIKTQAFKNFDYHFNSYIQEIHLYPDGWFNDFEEPYQVILMLKPEAPKLKVSKTNLTITLPKRSPLWKQGLVKDYLVTILNGKDKPVLLETDQNKLEFELNPSGKLMGLDKPNNKEMRRRAMLQRLYAKPHIKERLVKQHGSENVLKAIDELSTMELESDVMERSAEILKQIDSGQATDKQIVVSVQEIFEGDRPIFGPVGEPAQEKITMKGPAKASLIGSWKGKIQFSNQEVQVDIMAGKYGFDYLIHHSLYAADKMIFHGKERNDGLVELYVGMEGQKVKAEGKPFSTIIKNSEKEIYMAAPPTTLRKK